MKYHVWHDIGSIIKQRGFNKKGAPHTGARHNNKVIWKCNFCDFPFGCSVRRMQISDHILVYSLHDGALNLQTEFTCSFENSLILPW